MNSYSIITGATGVIGEAFSKKLALKGENLYLSGRSIEKLTLLKNKLLDINSKIDIKIFACDLSNFSSVEELFNDFNKLNAKVTGLYYVSGIDTQKPFIDYSCDKIVNQARVNFEGALLLTNFALKNKGDNLKILIVSSMCGLLPMPFFAEYSATKSALINFFTALRYENIKNNIKITILAPGSVPTRPDIIRDIKSQGLTGKLSSKTPDFVVCKALKALEKNKKICIPGFYNKIVNFLNKITPNAIKLRIIKRKFIKKTKDNF